MIVITPAFNLLLFVLMQHRIFVRQVFFIMSESLIPWQLASFEQTIVPVYHVTFEQHIMLMQRANF